MTRSARRPLARRALAAAGAAALALLGTAIGSSAAQATDPPPPSPANITGTTGSIVIHKHAGDPGAAGDGKVITDPTKVTELGQGLDGVEFSVQRVSHLGVPIDLKTAEGWDYAEDVTVDNASTAPYSLTDVETVTTEGGGLATVDELPYGLYLISETSPGSNPIVSPVEPMLVSVPYQDETNSTWLYEVHVYPKNKLNETNPEKTVAEPGGLVLGSTVEWTVTAPIPELGAGDTYRKFVITDQLDPRLTLTGAIVSLDGVELDPGTDYTLSPDTLPAEGANVAVTLTAAGRAQLMDKSNVVVKLTTTVTSLGEGNTGGKISNTAAVNVNDSVRETDPAQTNWGPLKIMKVSATAKSQGLQGAEFTLHETKGGPEVDGVGTLTSNAAGVIVVDGLWVGNGATLTKSYWVQETKAPAGYVLPTGDGAWTEVVVSAGPAASVVVKSIANTQYDGPMLPLTGAAGTTAFMAGGMALVAIAGGAALAASRRKRGSVK
ncbi:SpaH/EbpB family LPXTG-anchored major pilin [Leucobacter sp. USHLN153]|uniref:SpaH/EbpB family LPXTG-anchored major pilin n=1 Tax=Leucobacter sp. USHLN153 TaxID=3081268 RepID=UPI003019736B